jgi:hypothetical protein
MAEARERESSKKASLVALVRTLSPESVTPEMEAIVAQGCCGARGGTHVEPVMPVPP